VCSAAQAMEDAAAQELASLASGHLGELVIRRSGKVALKIGDMMLDVQPGTACCLEQEIVAMEMPRVPGGDVQLHRLGKMHERMVVTPDIDALLGRTPWAAPPVSRVEQ
jgi:DNA-directed RNA polymerase III subunit RPC4